MSQNRSSAVMQQRRDRAHASLDDYPTPPWATRALFEHVLKPVGYPKDHHRFAWEPACNRGHMTKVLDEYFGAVIGSDIHQYSRNHVGDFLIPSSWPAVVEQGCIRMVCSNPPFKQAERFITTAQSVPNNMVTAMLVRTSFLEGAGRYRDLFKHNPPTLVAQFAERVIMLEGVLRDPDKRYWDGTAWRRPSTATSYCWLVWIDGMTPQPFVFIPPCRRALTRPGDYPANPDEEGVFTPPTEGEGLWEKADAT